MTHEKKLASVIAAKMLLEKVWFRNDCDHNDTLCNVDKQLAEIVTFLKKNPY